MQTINLKQYYPFCKEDIFLEVSDEIVEAFLLDKRAEASRERKMFRYKAFYSLDCNDGIENAAIGCLSLKFSLRILTMIADKLVLPTPPFPVSAKIFVPISPSLHEMLKNYQLLLFYYI